MQDQKLGKRCQVKECRQIDWMPMSCKYCDGIFCYNHYSIENHSCKEIEKDYKKVIECPFCRTMLKANPNLTAQETLSIHEATECKGMQVTKQLTCSREKCGTKITQINKFVCPKCDQIVCMKHRLPTDHNCVSGMKKRWMNFVQG